MLLKVVSIAGDNATGEEYGEARVLLTREEETDPFFNVNFTEERAALQERLNVYLEYVPYSCSPCRRDRA